MGRPANTRSNPVRTGPKVIASIEMTVRILERRAAHWTLAAIAKEEGISDRAVAKRIEKALQNAPTEPATHLRATLSEQVRYAMRAITTKVSEGNLAAIDRWYAGIERLSRLHGVDLTPTLIIETPLPARTLELLSTLEGEYKLLEGGENATEQRSNEGISASTEGEG